MVLDDGTEVFGDWEVYTSPIRGENRTTYLARERDLDPERVVDFRAAVAVAESDLHRGGDHG